MDDKYVIVSVENPDIPRLPDMDRHPCSFGSGAQEQAYHEYVWNCKEIARMDPMDYRPFLNGIAPFCLIHQEKRNRIFSPLCVFHALAVMADLAVGNTQEEILSVLGVPDMESARESVSRLYRSEFMQGSAEVRPSAMLWFDEQVKLNQPKMEEIAKTMYAGVCKGPMMDPAYQTAIASWLNEATGGHLPDKSRQMKIDADTMLVLLTTLYYRDFWDKEFDAGRTKDGVFHTMDGDVITPFMHASRWINVWIEESFTALPLEFMGGNALWLVLPKEGLSPEDLLKNGFFAAFPPDRRKRERRDVRTVIPKFDVFQELSIIDSLRDLGVKQVFTDDSQTPYTTVDEHSIKVDRVKHGARMKIDERGCEGSAYILMAACAGGIPHDPPPMDFILDRPFLFVLMGKGKLPLFVGIVHNPQEMQ